MKLHLFSQEGTALNVIQLFPKRNMFFVNKFNEKKFGFDCEGFHHTKFLQFEFVYKFKANFFFFVATLPG